MAESLESALESVIWYDGHYEWLEELADQLENANELVPNPFSLRQWHTEEHTIWMLLAGMFGSWGTSIRSGWIEETKEAAEYIRKLCKNARDEIDE